MFKTQSTRIMYVALAVLLVHAMQAVCVHFHNTGALTNMIYCLRKKIKGSGYDIVAERGQGYCFELE